MKKRDIKIIKDSLSVLVNQPLCTLSRAGTLIVTNFGELVEIDSHCYDENGKLVRNESGRAVQKKDTAGRYAIDVSCSVRMVCGDDILFSNSDILLPNSVLANKKDFDWDNFDWAKTGNNYFDEMVGKFFDNEPFNFVVEKVVVSRIGDLRIKFKNGFALELFANGSRENENWCFYDNSNDENHIVVMGDGLQIGCAKEQEELHESD